MNFSTSKPTKHRVKKYLLSGFLALAAGFLGAVFFSSDASATCLSPNDMQNISGEGTYETCGGDDYSYRVPILDFVYFGGTRYDSVYATTNSVIAFGRADYTWHTYPSAPSISFQGNDWVEAFPGGYWGANDNAEYFNITVTNSGFVVDLSARKYPHIGGLIHNVLAFGRNPDGTLTIQSFTSSDETQYRNGCRLGEQSAGFEIVDFDTCGITQQVSLMSISTFVEQITNNELPVAPVEEPVQDPGQESKTDSISGLSGSNATLVDIAVNGNFIEDIRGIFVNNEKVPMGSWLQNSSTVTFSVSKSKSGTYEVQLFNGSLPLVELQTFTLIG